MHVVVAGALPGARSAQNLTVALENALTTLRRAGQVRSEKRVWYCVEGEERV